MSATNRIVSSNSIVARRSNPAGRGSSAGMLVPATITTMLLSLAGAAHGQGEWSVKASSPTVRRGSGFTEVNGVIYAIGGSAPCASGSNNVVQAYIPATNSWTTSLPSAPVATQQLGAGTIDGLAYAVGGGTCCGPLNTLQRYNPSTNQWSVLPSMPTARYAPVVGVAGGRLYAMGGANGQGTGYTSLEIYNPATGWSFGASMSAYRGNASVGVFNGVLYVFGGQSLAGAYVNTVEAYSPATNSWTPRAPMPTARTNAAVAVLDGLIYVAGGLVATGGLTTVEAYDPVTNCWITMPSMPAAPAGALGAAVVDGVMYVIGNQPGLNEYCPGSTYAVFAFTPTRCPVVTQHPVRQAVVSGGTAAFMVVATGTAPLAYQWRLDGVPLANGGAISGATTTTLTIGSAALSDNAAAIDCVVTNACGAVTSHPAGMGVTPACIADVDDGSATGAPDGGITIDDLLYYLARFDAGC